MNHVLERNLSYLIHMYEEMLGLCFAPTPGVPLQSVAPFRNALAGPSDNGPLRYPAPLGSHFKRVLAARLGFWVDQKPVMFGGAVGSWIHTPRSVKQDFDYAMSLIKKKTSRLGGWVSEP